MASPCGACKFLRRKCSRDCVFAPYFSSEQGATRFAAIHKVFGASNASKLLLHVPQAYRCEAVVTIAYEAQARLRDPVYGCFGRILALQHQVSSLQLQLLQMKAQLAQCMLTPQSSRSQWQGNDGSSLFQPCSPPWGSFNFTDQDRNGLLPPQDVFSKESGKSRATTQAETEELLLQGLAFRTTGQL
ncbi:hypothetical protein OPV22_007252 [Ensete ventricosum]|uniref:LOB domain-containing protein n=1 Tax=Ensete ventricosum TaxID=4639 RepID=A0AAV8Q841_ENSVE|nr:hypothetical protein OPV22_007252 [Ensete ventricosum]RWW14604.1 hypothetical protein GW17_00021611 [Ensete ventricosum]RZR86843.1 hypothetical protein BHM03_00014125 [Ensete ventricosum]